MLIKEWAEEDRPREKLKRLGSAALSDAELLAILIGSGEPGRNALDIAREILHAKGNNLNMLGATTVGSLTRNFRCIGEAKAITILAALELGLRRDQTEARQQQTISSSSDIYRILSPTMRPLDHEEFHVMLLNQSNRFIELIPISKGGVSETTADIRIILRHAIDRLASAIVLAHNHPSGCLRPSSADDNFTRKMKEAALLMDIRMLDHLIIGPSGYYSYADEGRL
jgi:DNA repair protein RadC